MIERSVLIFHLVLALILSLFIFGAIYDCILLIPFILIYRIWLKVSQGMSDSIHENREWWRTFLRRIK